MLAGVGDCSTWNNSVFWGGKLFVCNGGVWLGWQGRGSVAAGGRGVCVLVMVFLGLDVVKCLDNVGFCILL